MGDSDPGLPLALAFVLLYLGATARGQATYWLARVAATQGARFADGSPRRRKFLGWLNGPHVARGKAIVEKYGLWAIPLAYLTVGVQTVIIGASGVLRISWVKFTLAQIPGALAWALIYATIGFAAWQAAATAVVTGHPLAVVALVVLVAAVIAGVIVLKRRRSAASPTITAEPTADLVDVREN